MLAKKVGICKIDASNEYATLQFVPQPPVEPVKIISLIQKSRHIKLHGQDKLRISANMPDLGARVTQVRNTIRSLLQ